MKQIDVMITAFRDGFQSAYGARVFTDDFLPAVEATRDAGIRHFEAGGGARFQALYFYCNEDAFTMMDRFRQAAGPEANLQTLSRGVNVVGLDSQPRDIIRMHAQLFKKHGITTIRNFDALNDVDNLIPSGEYIVGAGLKHEVVVTLMSLPPGVPGGENAHTPEFYTATLQRILDSGLHFDSLCYKDASGSATPKTVYESLRQARQILPPEVHLRFHSHDTLGTCVTQYMAALEAGADGIDLSMAPVSGGTCQSDVISMWHALRGSEFDLGIDIDRMREAEEVLKDCMKDYFLPPESRSIEPLIPFSPMPGGALTANTQMLRDNGILDRYPEIIRNMGEVVKLGGFGTSVTPVSQFYFQQAFNNTIFGPWEKIAEGYGKMVLGYFGRTPMEPDPEIVAIAAKQLGLEPTREKVVDLNDRDPSKGVDAARAMLRSKGLEESDENIFIAATCKEKGIAFLIGEGTVGVRKQDASASAGAKKQTEKKQVAKTEPLENERFKVQLGGKTYMVDLDGSGNARVNGRSYRVEVAGVGAGQAEPLAASAPAAGRAGSAGSNGSIEELKAPLPGKVIRLEAAPGTFIEEGALVLVLEAMKMENEIRSPHAGVLQELLVDAGSQVSSGDILARIRLQGVRS